MNYKMTIFIDDDIIIKDISYNSEYELKRDITNIGISGITQKINEKQSNEYFLYYPPHRIKKIEVSILN